MRKGSKKQDDTLCWDCKRACGGCPWSMSGTHHGMTRKPSPVDGWKARETTVRMQSTVNGVHNNARYVVSYIVEACPLFVPDRRAADA